MDDLVAPGFIGVMIIWEIYHSVMPTSMFSKLLQQIDYTFIYM